MNMLCVNTYPDPIEDSVVQSIFEEVCNMNDSVFSVGTLVPV